MEMSVRQARAQFAAALEAASRGERVTITKNGKPVAELGPAPSEPQRAFDLALLAARQQVGGLPDSDPWPLQYDHPEFSRRALDLEANPDITPA